MQRVGEVRVKMAAAHVDYTYKCVLELNSNESYILGVKSLETLEVSQPETP